jgi:hypothetical protein
MSKETSKPNIKFNDVYEPSYYFSNIVKDSLKKILLVNTNFKSFDGFYEGYANKQVGINDISNNIIPQLLNKSSYSINDQQNINTNSNNIGIGINEYNTMNMNTTKYDTIDDDGNLLINNTDINPNIIDAMMKDTKETLIQQNNIYIFGSIISTSIILGLVMIL